MGCRYKHAVLFLRFMASFSNEAAKASSLKLDIDEMGY